MAQVAHVEEYDSDESRVKVGTRVDARKYAASVRSARPTRSSSSAAGDSRYSSYTNATTAAGALVAAAGQRTQATQASASRSKPVVIHRGESQRTQQTQRPPSRSVSVARTSPHCNDPNCHDPKCLSTRNTDRRYTLPQQPAPQQRQQSRPPSGTQYPVQRPVSGQQYQQVPAYPYYNPAAAIASSTLNPQPASRGRPESWTGSAYSGTIYSSTPPQQSNRGPPPSPSAYHPQQLQLQLQQQQLEQARLAHYHHALAAAQLTSTPLNTAVGGHAPLVSSALPTPTSQRPELQHAYSARVPSSGAAYPLGTPAAQPQSVPNTYSARRPSIMPGSFPDDSPFRDSAARDSAVRNPAPRARSSAIRDPSSDSDAASYSDSASEYEESRYVRRERHVREKQTRQRDTRAMPPPAPPPARRPSFRSTSSMPAVSTRRYSRSGIDYDPPSFDSARTARPSNPNRLSDTSSRSSRQPSVSTTSSSGRTKTTSSSNASTRYIVEDSRGRKACYTTREEAISEAERMAPLLARSKLEDDVEAYQTRIRGGLRSQDLTAENIKRAAQPRPPAEGSRTSAGSRKSSHSKTSTSKSDHTAGFQIRSGNQVINVVGDAKIQMRRNEDGEQVLFLESNSGRDVRYESGSKSSGSRAGRSRTASQMRGRRDTILEEAGYNLGG